LPFKVSFARF
jgi:hypothetical protein